MAHLDYHRETFTFASAVPGTVNFDRTVGSLAATTAPLKRKTSNQLCSTNFCLLVLWLLLLPFGFIVKGAAAPALAYALTTTADPARPGQVTQFAMTVTNLSTASQYVTLSYHVPQFTSSGGYVAGTALTYVMGYVAVGATEVVTLDFTVLKR
jgi:hypothetical protein